ncbi:hypothetical protein FI667_g13621, partial [Globisporangium splendens]
MPFVLDRGTHQTRDNAPSMVHRVEPARKGHLSTPNASKQPMRHHSRASTRRIHPDTPAPRLDEAIDGTRNTLNERAVRPGASTSRDSQQQQQFSWRDAWKRAFRVVRTILHAVLACLACAWAANFCYSLGNIFSLQKSANQSTASLVIASLVWSNVLFCAIMLAMHTMMPLPQRFLVCPERRPTAAFCVRKLVRATWGFYLVTLTGIFAWGVLVTNTLPDAWRWLKLDFYGGSAINHVYTAGLELVTKRIYSEETCHGQQRQHVHAAQGLVMIHFAGAYVQIASQYHFTSSGTTELVAFAIVSVAIKLLIQDLAKRYVVKRKIQAIRTMCVIVGLPTVLIDTQVRVVVLRDQSTQLAAAGSIAMALLEIVLRLGKRMLLRMEIQHRHKTIKTHPGASELAIAPLEQQHISRSGRITTIRVASSLSNVSLRSAWGKQLQDFHTAEVVADMYAEYIAIGCSASILYFFSNHPKYQYGGSTSGSSDTLPQLQLLSFQLGLEAIVDYMSCVLEIAIFGAHLESLDSFGFFLAFLFMTIAVLNVETSALLYLK